MTVVYFTNISPTHAVLHKTPHEMWFGMTPKVHHLKVFGCVAYVHTIS